MRRHISGWFRLRTVLDSRGTAGGARASSGQTAPPVLRCDDELAPATRGLARSAGEQQACRARARAAVSLRRQSRPHVEQRGLQHPSSPKDGDPTLRLSHASFFQTDPPCEKVRRGLYSPGGKAPDLDAKQNPRPYFCFGGPHAGVGRVGLGPPVGGFPLFTLEFSQHKKNFPRESRCQPSPRVRSG